MTAGEQGVREWANACNHFVIFRGDLLAPAVASWPPL
jgi:hypothetical protein